MSAARLQKWFPWTISPVIVNGPMIGAASPHLAAEVTKAGGLGFIASAVDISSASSHLAKLDADLAESRQRLGDGDGPLRVGASFITGHGSMAQFSATALPLIAKHRPAAVWLFAPPPPAGPHGAIIRALKALAGPRPPPRVFVQVGTVAAAREAVLDGADALVCQGVDAGGHQFRRGAGVVALLPEVRRWLEEEAEVRDREVLVLAAGGVADGKGVAAMMTLGADGVVMGTRFTVADESVYPDFRKQLVLRSVDGGTSTLKSPFNDQLNNSTLWGPLYDGRAIVGPVHEKFLAGASLDDCRRSLSDEYSPEEAAATINTWAGTAVGLVRKAQPAGDIVREVREEAKQAIRKVVSSL